MKRPSRDRAFMQAILARDARWVPNRIPAPASGDRRALLAYICELEAYADALEKHAADLFASLGAAENELAHAGDAP